MGRVKAIFDTDILIHLIKTSSIEFATNALSTIYISEYVYTNEIKKDTQEGRVITKLKNKGTIKILKYEDLTQEQKSVYKETEKQLKEQDEYINAGERTCACFAKACNIYYYMSDDNKAASFIKSLAAVEVINFCDILYIYLVAFRAKDIEKLYKAYESFIKLYDEDKVPRVVKKDDGICTFDECMAMIYSKFKMSKNLSSLLENIIKKAK